MKIKKVVSQVEKDLHQVLFKKLNHLEGKYSARRIMGDNVANGIYVFLNVGLFVTVNKDLKSSINIDDAFFASHLIACHNLGILIFCSRLLDD